MRRAHAVPVLVPTPSRQPSVTCGPQRRDRPQAAGGGAVLTRGLGDPQVPELLPEPVQRKGGHFPIEPATRCREATRRSRHTHDVGALRGLRRPRWLLETTAPLECRRPIAASAGGADPRPVDIARRAPPGMTPGSPRDLRSYFGLESSGRIPSSALPQRATPKARTGSPRPEVPPTGRGHGLGEVAPGFTSGFPGSPSPACA